MAAISLVEMLKLNQNRLESAVIETFARTSDVLMTIPFDTINSASVNFVREQTLPGIGFRGINEGYTASGGVMKPITEVLTIMGGDLDVDRFLIQTGGAGARARHTMMKIKALALRWTEAFIKGDSSSDPRELDGLQTRITLSGAQDFPMSSAGALSCLKVDEAIDEVDSPTHIICNKATRRNLTSYLRTTGSIEYTTDGFGRKIPTYAGLPLLIVDEDNDGNQILDFSETSSTSSLYVVSFGTGMLTGIQDAPISVRDLGEIDGSPVHRTRAEWYAGISAWSGRCAARVRLFTNATAVA